MLKVVDTVGAEDGFAVGVISALLDGMSLHDGAARGNAIGAHGLCSSQATATVCRTGHNCPRIMFKLGLLYKLLKRNELQKKG